MSTCCFGASVPATRDVELDFEEVQPTWLPGEALPAVATAVSPLTLRGMRGSLANFRDRHEQQFEQVLDQLKAFSKQLAALESAIEANSDAQESFKAEFRDLSSMLKSKYTSKDVAANIRENGPTSAAEDNTFEPEGEDKFKRYVPPPDLQQLEGDSQSDPGLMTLGSKDDPSRPDPLHDPSSNRSSFGRDKSHSNISLSDSALRRTLSKKSTRSGKDKKGYLGRINNVLSSEGFELAIAAAILINAFIMCLECQYQGLGVGFSLQYPGRPVEAHHVWMGADIVFIYFDWLFGSLFLVEMIVKLICWRHRYFYSLPEVNTSTLKVNYDSDRLQNSRCLQFLSGVQGWNLLDGVTVVVFLFEKIQAAAGFVNPQMIRLLRLFRLGRLVRLLRFIESLDQLYVMTTAISGLRQALGWAIVLLTLLLLTCDLFLVQLLQVTYFDQVKASDLTEDKLKKYHEMYAYFGTCTRCMLSMFEITLGNWPPIARLLSEEVSEFFTPVCLVHKLTIGFAVVGVITGCILEETFKVARTDDIIMYRQKKKAGQVFKMKMQALFEALDKSRDGKMTAAELETIVSSLEIQTWLSSLNIEVSDLRTLFDLIDFEGRGYITLDELQMRMPRIQGNARSIDVLAIQKQMWKNSQRSAPPERKKQTISSFADFLYSPKVRKVKSSFEEWELPPHSSWHDRETI